MILEQVWTILLLNENLFKNKNKLTLQTEDVHSILVQ